MGAGQVALLLACHHREACGLLMSYQRFRPISSRLSTLSLPRFHRPRARPSWFQPQNLTEGTPLPRSDACALTGYVRERAGFDTGSCGAASRPLPQCGLTRYGQDHRRRFYHRPLMANAYAPPDATRVLPRRRSASLRHVARNLPGGHKPPSAWSGETSTIRPGVPLSPRNHRSCCGSICSTRAQPLMRRLVR